MGRKPFEPLSEAEIAYGRAHYGTGLNSWLWQTGLCWLALAAWLGFVFVTAVEHHG